MEEESNKPPISTREIKRQIQAAEAQRAGLDARIDRLKETLKEVEKKSSFVEPRTAGSIVMFRVYTDFDDRDYITYVCYLRASVVLWDVFIPIKEQKRLMSWEDITAILRNAAHFDGPYLLSNGHSDGPLLAQKDPC